jgi:16S rRNA (cytosine967-C5)-methyltransferase
MRELEDLPAHLDRSPFVEQVLDAAVGSEPTRRESLWRRLQEPPRPTFRHLRGEVPAGLEPDLALDGCLRLGAAEAFPHEWLGRGEGLVQDRSSQALMAFRCDPAPARILDACAAPGGKTATLIQRFPDAAVTALERESHRLRRLRENLARWRLQAQLVQAEAASWLRGTEASFDLILVDAPCTGSGTLAKHPELGWLGGRLDLGRLLAQQRDLLEAAWLRLAPRGLLIYSVCSWLPEEGEGHREALLRNQPCAEPADLWPEAFGLRGWFRPDPLEWEGEGFQGFAVRRTK